MAVNGRSGSRDPYCTVIGQGSHLEGSLQVDHAIHVQGVLCGELSTPARLLVGAEGQVTSTQLDVGEAEIHGQVTGHLRARLSVHLGATGCLHGSVETPRLVVEEGARLIMVPRDVDAPGPVPAAAD